MKKNVLESKMKLHGDTQKDLAEVIGISLQTFNKKLNGTDGGNFSQLEIMVIKLRYNLTPEEIDEIFFSQDVSKTDTQRKEESEMFAKNLKMLMDEKRISQQELAIRIGKGKSSVSQYLSGKNVPRPEVKEKIAEVLECSVSELDGDSFKLDYNMNNISVAECAKILGKSEQFVRVGLQQGIFTFGFAVRTSSKYSYHISPKKLNEYINS